MIIFTIFLGHQNSGPGNKYLLMSIIIVLAFCADLCLQLLYLSNICVCHPRSLRQGRAHTLNSTVRCVWRVVCYQPAILHNMRVWSNIKWVHITLHNSYLYNVWNNIMDNSSRLNLRVYMYNEDTFFCLFVNHVKTTERINMGLRPNDAKLFLDGHRPYTLPHFFLD